MRRVAKGKSWRKALDDLCRRATFARDHHRCVKCGKGTGLQWSHVRSRRYLSTRWSMYNVKTLCAGCHLWWGQNPLAASEWFSKTFPERARLVLLASHGAAKPTDREAVRLGLEAEIQRWEEP